MSQILANPLSTRSLPAANVGSDRIILWVFIALGMIAPLLLVVMASLTSADALVRAQIIVQGTERLALLLIGAGLVSVLYILGVREAELVAGQPQAAAGTAY